MKKITAYFCFLLAIGITVAFLPLRGGKTAYKLHYRGTLHFIDGKYNKAANLFQRAYQMEPENFNFALSLGLGLGRTGETVEGISVLKNAYLPESDPSYQQKMVLKLFFEGMVHSYAGHFHKAIPLYKRAIEMQEPLREPEMLSIIHNALGYAILLNQGRGAHGRDELPAHYHVHRRDMERALLHFEEALASNAGNESARHNYTVLSDSLGVAAKVFEEKSEAIEALKSGNTYDNLPDNISRAMDFANFDEVVFLLDISGSMVQEKVVCKGDTRFNVMKETMQHIVDNINPDTQIGLGTIGGDCDTEPRLWLPSAQLTRRELRIRLNFLTPDGTTPLLTILKRSPELFSDETDRKKAIFLVSDGANICSAQGLDICEWAKALPGENITVNILTFLETNFKNTNAFAEYTCLTDNTGGRILYIDNYRCRMERYEFDLVETCQFRIPEFQRVECWGPAVENLWAIFGE